MPDLIQPNYAGPDLTAHNVQSDLAMQSSLYKYVPKDRVSHDTSHVLVVFIRIHDRACKEPIYYFSAAVIFNHFKWIYVVLFSFCLLCFRKYPLELWQTE